MIHFRYMTVRAIDEVATGKLIRARRLRMNITLREWCRALGLDPANYSRAERGLGGLSQTLLDRINGYLESRKDRSNEAETR